MNFTVKKGLERPLRVQGMLLRYFYSWLVIGGVLGVILLIMLMQASRGQLGFGTFVIALTICLSIFLSLKFIFVNISKVEKMKFRKHRGVISHVDIMKSLK